MEITLIKAISGNEIHGADNAKKTGCGINLSKPENISRYITNGVINDMNEAMNVINCEKCKQVLAKRSIKADRKEMKNLIKEERARAKKGIEDENIIPLGGTQARGYLPDAGSRRPAPYQSSQPSKPVVTGAAPVSPMYNPNASNPYGSAPASTPSVPQNTAKPAENDIMSQFAIPKQNAPAPSQPAPAPKPAVPKNDIMSQFAIPAPAHNPADDQPVKKAPVDLNSAFSQFAVPSNKPVDTVVPEAPKNVVSNIDDVLAQFVVPSPQQNTAPVQPEPVQNTNSNPYMDDTLAQFAVPSPQQNTAPVQPEPVQNTNPNPYMDDTLAQFTVPSPQQNTEVEIIGNEPEEQNTYANEDVVDIEPVSNTAVTYAQPAEANQESNETNWDTVANQVFGDAEDISSQADKLIDEFMSAPEVTEEAVTEPAETPDMNEIPSVDSVPETNKYTTPFENEQPVKQEESDNLYRYTPPVFPDEPIMNTPVAPMVPPITPIAPPMENINVNPTAPQQLNQFANQTIIGYDQNGQPMYGFVQPQFVGYDQGGQPVFAPVQPMQQAPVAPAVPPVQPMQQAPVTPAVPPVQPMQQTPVAPAVPPVQPMQQTPVAPAVPPIQPMQQTPVTPAVPPVQPMQQAPVTPAVPPVQPMQQAPVVPPVAPMAQAPVQPMSAPAFTQPQQVNLSQVGMENAQHIMPDAVASAVAKSREMQKTNIFDMQGIQMPVLDSIEDALSQMGEQVKTKQEIIDSSTSTPFFEEYKVPPKMTSYAPTPKFNQMRNETPQRALSKSEMKNLKKQEKIDAKFKKELAKRGF